jgi:hypothetical protein
VEQPQAGDVGNRLDVEREDGNQSGKTPVDR